MIRTCKHCPETDQTKFPKNGRECKACRAKKLREYRSNNIELKATRKNYRDNNRNKINEQKRISYNKHSTQIKKTNNNYYHKNAERCKERQRLYQAKIETASLEAWLMKCMKHSKASDKKYNRKFDLNLPSLIEIYNRQYGRCALTNIAMTINRKDPNAISIDRINSDIGHTIDNIQLVCGSVNLAKKDFTNKSMIDFFFNIYHNISISTPNFLEFSYPESTAKFTALYKYSVELKLRNLFTKFVPPSYSEFEMRDDLNRLNEQTIDQYLVDSRWRSNYPQNLPWPGKKIVYEHQKHLWDVRTQGKPLISEVWGNGPIFDRAINNLINGDTKISFDRIIRELVFAGAGIPSQMHPGFAKAVYSYFGIKKDSLIYDPCAGWGARMLAAYSLGAKYICCEKSAQTYAGLSRIATLLKYYGVDIRLIDCLDNHQPIADIMFTSPPFGSEEYLGSDALIDINKLMANTVHIPIRVLHVNEALLSNLTPNTIIPINTKKQAGGVISEEFLAIWN